MFGRRKHVDDELPNSRNGSGSGEVVANSGDGAIDELPQATSTLKGLVPVMACGAGLFSDGYINNVRVLEFPTRGHNYIYSANSF